MSQASYIQDMMEDQDVDQGISEIANFYNGCNILLTGGSGFLGRLLIERILRSCPRVNTLFLLIRAKKGKSPDERFKELFDDIIFNRLKKERPAFARKIVLVEGDMGVVGLGLSAEQKEQLRSSHIVIHGAATVRFDEKLRIATNINVRGTKELLSLAKEMTNLKAFVHISTAYSNCVQKEIEEKFYSPPIDYEKLIDLLNILDDATLDHLTPVLLGKWPNTYSFTKAVAEDIVRRNSKYLPACIVRPSIVIATAKEPIAGWINNYYGATGIVIGVGVGLMRTVCCNVNLVADIIPADYVVTSVILAAWDTAKTQNINANSTDGSTVPEVKEPLIYNAVSSCQSPITWGQVLSYGAKPGKEFPSILTIWYLFFKPTKNRWIHSIYVIFLHLIPAAIVDSLAWLTGRKPMLWAAYKKIHKLGSIVEFFSLQQWKFYNKNILQLREKLGRADRNTFDLVMEGFDWEEYNYNHIRGLRVYLLKDPLDTLPQARAKYAKIKAAHYTLIAATGSIFIWILFMCLRAIGLW